MSQFTLYGILKGNKPDFHVAMPPAKAKPFYASLVEKFQKSYKTDSVKGNMSMLLILHNTFTKLAILSASLSNLSSLHKFTCIPIEVFTW